MKEIQKQDHSAVCYQLLTKKTSVVHITLGFLVKYKQLWSKATTWVLSGTWQCHKCHSCGSGFEFTKEAKWT